MSFKTTTKVRFAHVDGAGIVFYPRYFEMLNSAVEDWFASMGLDFRAMHLDRGIGIPTVRLECEFVAPSVLGDDLTIEIMLVELGRTSFTIACRVSGSANDTVRLTATAVLVCMDLHTKKAIPWADSLKQQLDAAT